MTAGELLWDRFGESCRRCGGFYAVEHVPQIMLEEGGSGVMLACTNCGERVDHVIGTTRADRTDRERADLRLRRVRPIRRFSANSITEEEEDS